LDQLRQAIATIRAQLVGLNSTHKLLIGSGLVIAVMAMFLVSQYAGSPQLVELMPGVPPAEQQRAAAILRASNFEIKDTDGRLMVKPGVQVAALATLQEQGQLPGDTSLLFRNLIEKQSWQNSRTQNEQMFQIALQNELGHVISNFRGIRSATVLIDAPQAQGLGTAVRRPTASVTVFTDSGLVIEQSAVDAIASLVSGAKSGLLVENVRVIDGSTGRQRVPTSSDQVLPTQYREQAAATEEQKRRQILDLLSYIPGVVVAVTAEVDITQRRAQETSYRSIDEGGTVSLLARETKNSVTESTSTQSAEPGLRSNQTLDISRGGTGSGVRSEQKDADTEMENRIGSKVEQIVDPRGMPTRLAASVNIPEGYIEGLVRKAKESGAAGSAAGGGAGGGAGAAVTQSEIDDRFDVIATRVRESLLPHLKTQGVDGEVRVSMVPMDVPEVAGGSSQAGMFGGGGGLLASGGGGLIEKVVLAALAVVAIGMMVAMVRRGGKPAKLPTPQEIIGIPPTLDTGSSVVGEADEIETAMAGIEVEEGSVRVQKMLEQLTEIVEADPAGTTKVLNRWLQVDR
jgi:flagellar biosynthesis/type III secretory pathway M-ring protein FliF/YscJ